MCRSVGPWDKAFVAPKGPAWHTSKPYLVPYCTRTSQPPRLGGPRMRPSSSPGGVSFLGGSWNSARGSSPRPGSSVQSRDWDPVARDAKRELSRIKYSEADPDAFTVRLEAVAVFKLGARTVTPRPAPP